MLPAPVNLDDFRPKPIFQPFPKIARLFRDCVITEKIDGTNAAVVITEDGRVYAQSRKRFVEPGDDNFGFAAWVDDNSEELLELGPGHHYGEWYGKGIQRGYGLSEKRFALFNTHRWANPDIRPDCCQITPLLYEGRFTTAAVNECMTILRLHGTQVRDAVGSVPPEGVVVFHSASNTLFKATFDDGHKG